MTELEQKIVEAQDAYYNGNPIMSDGDFDELWDKLKAEQPDSELLTEVGADHTDGFPKVKHNQIMGSQNKANTEDEMDKWISTLSDKNAIGQFKMDGCLAYDTLLETDKGILPIGKIVEERIPCKVKAYDVNNGVDVWTPIKNYFININNYKWYELKTNDGKTLIVTENHKVWLPKLLCWRQVKDLKEGDEFQISQ